MLKVTCQRCKGIGHVEEKLKNLGTLDWDWHIIACPMCDAKGYITQADRDSYYASWGFETKGVQYEQSEYHASNAVSERASKASPGC